MSAPRRRSGFSPRFPYLEYYGSVSGYDADIPNAVYNAERDSEAWPEWAQIDSRLPLRITYCGTGKRGCAIGVVYHAGSVAFYVVR